MSIAVEKKPVEMRAVYAQTLLDLAAGDPRIVVLEADLMRASGTGPFARDYPDRAFNVGVAEANMVGIAAGLSTCGKIPFAATFACFASRRAYDQFFISGNYARLNIKLVGTDPGVTARFNGGTHMPFEDLALMRVIPKLVVIEPSDNRSLAALLKRTAAHEGCVYVRLHRFASPDLYAKDDDGFEIGRGRVLREGADATIIALGAVMVNEALGAADLLAREGLGVTVIDALTLKPLDTGLVLQHARKTGCVVTCENAQASGGLGSAVAEVLLDAGLSARFARVGVQDEFAEVGTQEYLQERFGLTARHIADKLRGMVRAPRPDSQTRD